MKFGMKATHEIISEKEVPTKMKPFMQSEIGVTVAIEVKATLELGTERPSWIYLFSCTTSYHRFHLITLPIFTTDFSSVCFMTAAA